MLNEDLIRQFREGDNAALDTLMARFKPLVKSKAKAYYIIGGEPEDLIQEGMIGLYKAVQDFDESKNAKFSSFAALCIVRQIQTAIKIASRKKNSPLNDSVSLNNHSNQEETYIDTLPAPETNDPEVLLLERETLREMDEFINQNLTALEYSVLKLHISGKTHAEMAAELGKNTKAIDNTIQRVRKKIFAHFK